MKRNLFIFISILLLSLSARASTCEIKPPYQLVINDQANRQQLEKVFTFSHCQEKTVRSFGKLIKDYRGNLNERLVRLELKNQNIKLVNSSEVISLADYIKEKLRLDKKLAIINEKFITSHKNFIALSEFDEVKIECDQCETLGDKTAQITTQNQQNRTQKFWLKFDIATTVNTLAPIRTIRVTNQPLSAKYFDWKEVTTSTPEVYFTDLRNIRFYYANQTIKSKESLKRRSLSRAKLVHYGRPVVIQMTKGSLKLKGKALPSKSGHLGETISLKNSRTKKIIIGKIIDKNLVEVEL